MAEKTVNQEAEELVYGPREESYSHPIVDFTTTANIWSALIKSHTGQDVELDAEMVAVMMAGLKLSRLSRNPTHRDSIIDVCGYMATYERVLQARDEATPGWANRRDVGSSVPYVFETEAAAGAVWITTGQLGTRCDYPGCSGRAGHIWDGTHGEQPYNDPPFQGEFGNIETDPEVYTSYTGEDLPEWYDEMGQ